MSADSLDHLGLRERVGGGNLWHPNQMTQGTRPGDVSNLLADWRLGAADADARLLAAVIAARVMRVLVDHARKRDAVKRGAAKRAPVSVSKVADPGGGRDVDVALDVALEELATLDPRHAQIVQLRSFGGLTEADVSEILDVSAVTVRRDVASAKFFLGRRMRGA
jgi:DNA-directed RNA polymerase specialized sigma24 family protein